MQRKKRDLLAGVLEDGDEDNPESQNNGEEEDMFKEDDEFEEAPVPAKKEIIKQSPSQKKSTIADPFAFLDSDEDEEEDGFLAPQVFSIFFQFFSFFFLIFRLNLMNMEMLL